MRLLLVCVQCTVQSETIRGRLVGHVLCKQAGRIKDVIRVSMYVFLCVCMHICG